VIRLKFERLNRQVSQQKLALAAQLPQPVVSLIETGTWNPRSDQLAALARVLHIDPPSDLLLDVVVPSPESRRTVEAVTR
jgi:transcriptional regulator with XRE-family HTH domain